MGVTSPKLVTIAAVFLVVSLASTARAEPEASPTGEGGIGIGAEGLLTGPTGGVFIYDMGSLRIDALLGVNNITDDSLFVAGRVLVPLHGSQDADFSIGGGLGLVHLDVGGNNEDEDRFHIEGLAQIRAFIASNVALSGAAGVVLIVGDGDDEVVLTGQLIGTVGIAYYFL